MTTLPRIRSAISPWLVVCTLLIACAPFLAQTPVRAQEPVTIRFWTTDEGNYSAMVEQFEAEHPDITVETQFVGDYDDMAARMQTAIVGGDLPDVAQVGQRYGIPQMVDAGVVIPASDYLSEEDIDDILPGLWSRYTYRGDLWAVPFESSTPGLWYNATMMEEAGIEAPPETWEELVTAAEAMTLDTDGDGEIDQWGFGINDDTPWYQRPMVLQAGGTLVAEDGTVTVNSPEAVEMLTFFQEAVHTNQISPPLGQQTARTDFTAGAYGMFFNSTASRVALQEEVGDRFELGVAFLPMQDQRAVGVGGNALIAVAAGDDAREQAATTFVSWMTDTDQAVETALTSGYVPIRQSAVEDPRIVELVESDPIVETIYAQLEYVADSSISPADALIWDGFLNALETVQTDASADPQELLDTLQADIDDYLANYE